MYEKFLKGIIYIGVILFVLAAIVIVIMFWPIGVAGVLIITIDQHFKGKPELLPTIGIMGIAISGFLLNAIYVGVLTSNIISFLGG